METKIEKQPNNVYHVFVKDNAEEIQKYFDAALKHESEHTEIKGYRKGKAPLNMVKEKVEKSQLRSHALNEYLPVIYQKLMSENRLKPILQPRFEIIKFEEGSEAEIKIVIIEKPEIELGDYINYLKIKIASLAKESNERSKLTNDEIIKELVKNGKAGIADILIDEETDRYMSSLIDQTAKLGLTIDAYLKSVNKTPEQLRTEYRRSAEENLKAEFLLTEISVKESVTVDDKEIADAINAVPDNKTRELLKEPDQKMYIKAVLTKSKTLEKLSEMTKIASEVDKKAKSKDNKDSKN